MYHSMSLSFLVLSLISITFVTATEVSKLCSDGFTVTNNNTKYVSISDCSKTCNLIKQKSYSIDFHFVPNRNVKNLKTHVFAKILGIPLPFIGVNGYSACNNITDLNNQTIENCIFKSGQEYIYRNTFPILNIYPETKMMVLWSLVDDRNEYVACFAVPARIRKQFY